jgi:hypothetical protein
MKSRIHEHNDSSIITASKKIVLIVALLATSFIQHSFAQDTKQPSQLLSMYFNIKDALVTGDANASSAQAEEFVKTVNGIGEKIMSEGNRNALLTDAGMISEMKDIKQQREHFASLSSNMVALAKEQKLSSQPINVVYCPMKKSYWLSAETTIKNPYFGNAMLTCGTVSETIK